MTEFRFFSYTDFEYHRNHTDSILNLPIRPYQPTRNPTETTDTDEEVSTEFNIPYAVFEILVAIVAVIGNLMVIIVFHRDRKLRRRTNYYIVSLAMADFLVGSLGVPFAIFASVGLPRNLHACLFTVSLLVVLCTISIFCLVAVSIDRYWAILYPMAYSRNVRTKTAIGIISMCWLAGTIVGFLPLFGWHADVGYNEACLFVKVMDYNYLVFLYVATIITPALLLLAFYAHIYRVIIKQVRQIVTMNPLGESSRRSSNAPIKPSSNRTYHGGTMLRVLGAARKRDVKATQNLSIIVLFFMICWIPLYTINCIKAFCPDCYVHPKLTFFCIILSHLNSAVNPVLYAYHLKDFRAALKALILKIVGVETDMQIDATHRFSLASQHRLHSVVNKRSSLQTKIYIDSPVWLRQQQQDLKSNISVQMSPRSGSSIASTLTGVQQTLTDAGSSKAETDRDIWNIVEASSGAEKDEDSLRHAQSSEDERDDQFSYQNRNYLSSPEDMDYDEVFLASQRGCIAPEEPYPEKFSSDNDSLNDKYKLTQQMLTDSSFSDYDIPKSRLIQASSDTTISLSPSNGGIEQSRPRTISSDGKHSSGVFVIQNDKNPLSPRNIPKLRKNNPNSEGFTENRQKNEIKRSCSCTGKTDLGSSNSFNNINHVNNVKMNNSVTFGEKFSPLRVMSNFIFSPVKHSSFIQLFSGNSVQDSESHPGTYRGSDWKIMSRKRATSDS